VYIGHEQSEEEKGTFEGSFEAEHDFPLLSMQEIPRY